MRVFLAGVLTAALAPSGIAASPRVAVLDLMPEEGVAELAARTITGFLQSEVARGHACELIGGAALDAAIRQGLDPDVCTNDQCLARFGHSLGADALVIGTVRQSQGSYDVHVRFLSISDGGVVSERSAASRVGLTSSSFREGAQEIVRQLGLTSSGDLPGGHAAPTLSFRLGAGASFPRGKVRDYSNRGYGGQAGLWWIGESTDFLITLDHMVYGIEHEKRPVGQEESPNGASYTEFSDFILLASLKLRASSSSSQTPAAFLTIGAGTSWSYWGVMTSEQREPRVPFAEAIAFSVGVGWESRRGGGVGGFVHGRYIVEIWEGECTAFVPVVAGFMF
jgi:hypothetical protein